MTSLPQAPAPETIVWHLASEGEPDADTTVLMAWSQSIETDELLPCEPERGWLDADGWHLAESGGLVAVPPTWWADWPNGPHTVPPEPRSHGDRGAAHAREGLARLQALIEADAALPSAWSSLERTAATTALDCASLALAAQQAENHRLRAERDALRQVVGRDATGQRP